MAKAPNVKRPRQMRNLQKRGLPAHIARKIAGPKKGKRA